VIRKKHPNKEIDAAISYAENHGWRYMGISKIALFVQYGVGLNFKILIYTA
jgi:hypothetical protein